MKRKEYLCLSLKQRKWKIKTKMALFKRSRFIHLFLCCDFLILIKQMHCTAFGTTKYCDLFFFFFFHLTILQIIETKKIFPVITNVLEIKYVVIFSPSANTN